MPRKETELYEPVASFLREKGFKVRSEVKGCDVAAIKEETLVVVELKLKFNIKLLMQATDRLTITDYVYIAIPRPELKERNNINSQYFRSMLNILKRLQIGLFLVALDSPIKTVEPILHPMTYTINNNRINRLNVIKEIDTRVGDFNTGGSTRTKITTAYREKSVQIACILKEKGEVSTKELRLLGITSRELLMLSNNYYNWFERIKTGVYRLTATGYEAIENPEERYKKMVEHYMATITNEVKV